MAHLFYIDDNNGILAECYSASTNWTQPLIDQKYLSSSTPQEAACPALAPFRFIKAYQGYGSFQGSSSPAGYCSQVLAHHATNKDYFFFAIEVKQSSDCILLGDSWHTKQPVAAPGQQYMIARPTVNGDYKFYVNAHGGNGNFSFLDGHVAAVQSVSKLSDHANAEYVASGAARSTCYAFIGTPDNLTSVSAK